MTFVSYSQNFEDILLWRALKDVNEGRYVDIGAQDPIIDSVSLAFYQAGWRGIHVEPVPDYAAKLRQARPDELVIEAAVSDQPGPRSFYELGGLSSGRIEIAERHKRSGHQPREIMVATVPLAGILENIQGDIHWLKIDVEGMEVEVLRSWGTSPVRPWVIVIESTAPNSEEQTQHLWIDEVLDRGYQEVLFDGLNRYFVHGSRPELQERLSRPANVFDRFAVTVQHFCAGPIAAELGEARHLVAREQARAEDLEAKARRAESACEVARAEQMAATERLAAAERDHRAAQEALWQGHRHAEQQAAEAARQFEAELRQEARQTEERIRQEARAVQDQLREELNQAQSVAATARAECARLEERAVHLEEKLGRAEAAAAAARNERALLRARGLHLEEKVRNAENLLRDSEARLAASDTRLRELRLVLDEHEAERERTIAESSSALAAVQRDKEELWLQLDRARTEIDMLRLSYENAAQLIRRAALEPKGAWLTIGERLGAARPSRTGQAIKAWVASAALRSPQPGTEQGISQEVGSDMQAFDQTGTRNPYLRASSLIELLSWSDVDFVRCAYVTILGRQPDPEGEAYYSSRLRRGHSKMEILWQLRHSREAASHDPGIAGLDRALNREHRRTWLSRTMRTLRGERQEIVPDLPPPPASEPSHSALPHSNANRIDDLVRDKELLSAEVQSLKGVVDGLAHAVRGIANAQARQEQQIRTMQSAGPVARRRTAAVRAKN